MLGLIFSWSALRLRPTRVLDDLPALLPLVAARRVVQKLRLNQGKDPFNSLKEKDWSDQPKRTDNFRKYARTVFVVLLCLYGVEGTVSIQDPNTIFANGVIHRIGSEVGAVRPLNSSQDNSGLCKDCRVPQWLEDSVFDPWIV